MDQNLKLYKVRPQYKIAFVCPGLSTSLARALWYGFKTSAQSSRVSVTAVVGGFIDEPDLQLPGKKLYSYVNPQNFDGALIYSSAFGHYSSLQSLTYFCSELSSLPIVSIGVDIPGVSSIVVDNEFGMATIAKHLIIDHKLRKFAFIRGPEGQVEAEERFKGFRNEVIKHQIPESAIRVFSGDFSPEAGRLAVLELLAKSELPEAIVCADDDTAQGVMKELRSHGIKVPEQVAVTGFDDAEIAIAEVPPLTTVNQPVLVHGIRALELLVELLESDDPKRVVKRSMPTVAVIRESCGCGGKVESLGEYLDSSDADLAIIDFIMTSLKDLEISSDRYKLFVRSWLKEFLTEFEKSLENGELRALRRLWERYFQSQPNLIERGVILQPFFDFLLHRYGQQPNCLTLLNQCLIMVDVAEARKMHQVDRDMRAFFFDLHNAEEHISGLTEWTSFRKEIFFGMDELGILGLAVVQQKERPVLVSIKTPNLELEVPSEGIELDPEILLPETWNWTANNCSRVVEPLVSENEFLGYAVFWVETTESYVCDFLATLIASAVKRLHLLAKIKDQTSNLERSLEEMRLMQKQLVETEKIASMSRLVAGVAHEINTPLGTGITGTSYILEKFFELKNQFESGQLTKTQLSSFIEQTTEGLTGVLRNLAKGADLVQAFKGLGLDFREDEWKPVRIKGFVVEFGALFSTDFKKKSIEYIVEGDEEFWVYVQPLALVQVLTELYKNVVDHAFEARTSKTQATIVVRISGERDYYSIQIEDNGMGMDKDTVSQLFEPLFTTKRGRGHPGLGLHLIYNIVTQTLGGTIKASGSPGEGSQFVIRLPLQKR